MKRQKAKVPSIEEIRSYYEKGDIKALRRTNEILAKRANQRLSVLEKVGLDSTQAYKRVTAKLSDFDFAKNDRFSRSKKLSIDDLYDQVKAESNFLRWQTSTPAGEMKRREEIWKSLTTQKIDEVTGDIKEPTISLAGVDDIDAFKKKFLDFLDTNAWEELKKHLYTTHILNDAGEAVAAGASIEELSEAMKSYMDGDSEEDLFTIWENWTSVK